MQFCTVLFYTVLAQLAERRSPKPDAAGPSPANGAIAEGSAYPAHDRMQTENCVTKPRSTHRKEFSTMKREDVKNRIPGITEEQLDWLMTENGSDINREKSAAAARIHPWLRFAKF